jgi:hypothetical protein
MEQHLPHLRISRFSKASPEAIYDLLADLPSHIMAQRSITNPALHLGPAMSRMTWLMTPMFAGRGLRNLLALAEQSRSQTVIAGSPKFTQEV